MIAAATSSGKVLLPYILQNMVHHTLLLMCNFGSTAKPTCEERERESETAICIHIIRTHTEKINTQTYSARPLTSNMQLTIDLKRTGRQAT